MTTINYTFFTSSEDSCNHVDGPFGIKFFIINYKSDSAMVLFVCMVFLRCMEPVVIQQRDQQLYVTSEPRRERTSIT